ncbi:hypothetical protein CCAN12_810013 [Capnocytophaga canimorsus]|uniref:Uncharacterized protein n=1 Tax=Capnocytophaga canimorsus TaxID=28188 RepID=A0A0B7HPW7_9FLAO|nr:hypothetical protein CCAN12_810013 [Capnocytophaga canimorsus]
MEENTTQNTQNTGDSIIKITGMYQNWFLDYASYVILERAVPAIEDGFLKTRTKAYYARFKGIRRWSLQ